MQLTAKSIPSINEITEGLAVFGEDMPIWNSKFSDDIWSFIDIESPLYNGVSASSFLWFDYMKGRGATFNRQS
jgi:hypothetical protein